MSSLTNGDSNGHVLIANIGDKMDATPEVNGVTSRAPKINGQYLGETLRSPTNGHHHNLENGIRDAPEPIAIVGMALRLPGGIRSPEELWKLLLDKKTTKGLIPSDRYNIEAFYTPSKRVGSVGMKHGHFLDENLEHIDTSFFTMSKAEIGKVDPQQRMLLEVVWECMESAGQIGWRGSDVGVFVGCWGEASLQVDTGHRLQANWTIRIGLTSLRKIPREREFMTLLGLETLLFRTEYHMNMT